MKITALPRKRLYIESWRRLRALPPHSTVLLDFAHTVPVEEARKRFSQALNERINARAGLHTCCRDDDAALDHDRRVIEDVLVRHLPYCGCNRLHSHYLARRYPQIHNAD